MEHSYRFEKASDEASIVLRDGGRSFKGNHKLRNAIARLAAEGVTPPEPFECEVRTVRQRTGRVAVHVVVTSPQKMGPDEEERVWTWVTETREQLLLARDVMLS